MNYRPEYDMKVIGQNLKRLRETKSLSVKDVQKYLRLGSVQAIYKYENGKGYPQVDTMFALMELYEANLSDIINKYEKDIFSLINLERALASGRPDFHIDIIDANMEIFNFEEYRVKHERRLIRYVKLYK